MDDLIERRRLTGSKDRGDISGIRHMGERVVVEVKDVTRWPPAEWLREAETARGNDDAVAGLVIAKRREVADPGKQIVMLTLADLVALMTGERPDERDEEATAERRHYYAEGPVVDVNTTRWAWADAAACRGGDVSLFLGSEGERPPNRDERESVARDVCSQCPVRIACLEDAMRRKGLWGVRAA